MTQRPGSLLRHPKPASLRAPQGGASGTDPLSDVLRTVRLTGAVFSVVNLSSPCDPATVPEGVALAHAIAPRAQNVISYHLMVRASCWAGLA